MTQAQTASSIETPYAPPGAVVAPEWIDRNGHMSVGFYHIAFETVAEPFFEWLGLTPAFRDRDDSSTFALESHLNFLREVKRNDTLRFESRLLNFDHKRIHFYQEMFHVHGGYLAASYESLSSYVDIGTRRTKPMPAVLSDRLGQVLAAHSSLPKPWQVGRAIGTRPVHSP
jgi:acyl-CoA thioester hydrolase